VLQRVNARPFAAEVRVPLAGASFAKEIAATLDEARAALARPTLDGWLVRRTFGAAGRGRRRIAAGKPTAAELAWLVASLRLGALVIEPWVTVTREYTRSAWVAPSGAVTISRPCFQETTSSGAWTRTEAAERGAVSRDDDARLAEAVEAAGKALARAGYFGPFGIDAFRHRSAHGEVLNPLSEINARYTMDFATAFDAGAPFRASP
jgi:phosphoribosylaminoimidazole carboxylase (NCAIR synthetase)